jgi:hypothetical protein
MGDSAPWTLISAPWELAAPISDIPMSYGALLTPIRQSFIVLISCYSQYFLH